MKFNAAFRRRPRGDGAYKRLRGDTDDHDDVLLPADGTFSSVSSLFSPELKFYDTFLTNQTIVEVLSDPAAVISRLAQYDTPFAPETGSGPSHRNGSYCKVMSWQLRGQIEVRPISNSTRAPMGRRVMLSLILEKFTDYGGALFSPLSVFISPNGEGATYPLRSAYRGDRFEVLKTEFYDIPPGAFIMPDPLFPDQIVASGTVVGFDFFIPLNVLVKFNAAVNSRDHLSCVNNLFSVICTVSQHPGYGVEFYQEPTLEYHSRFRYYTQP